MFGGGSVDRVQVCGIRTFFRAVLAWLIRHTCSNSAAAHVHASLSLIFNGHEQAGVDDRKRTVEKRGL